MSPQSASMTATEWALLALLSVVWGGSFFFGEIALAELRPFSVVLGRVGLGAAALYALVRLSGHAMPTEPRVWLAFFAMGLLNNVIPFSLIFWGQTQIASGLASILNATTPLFGVVFAHVLTRDERMTRGRLAGVLFGMAGVAVMIGPDAFHGLGLNIVAQLAVLGAAMSYALAGIFGRRFRGMPPLVPATGQVTASAALIFPVAMLADRPWTGGLPGPDTLGAILGLALLCTALAYFIYFRILARAGATNILLVTFLIPVSALVLGMAVLGEDMAPRHFLGMALIGIGLGAIDGRPLRWLALGQAPAQPPGADGQGQERVATQRP